MQNMPGAASLIAANQVYNIAKPDGLTLGAIYPALYLAQLIGKHRRSNTIGISSTWIGTPERSGHLMYMRADTPYKTHGRCPHCQ